MAQTYTIRAGSGGFKAVLGPRPSRRYNARPGGVPGSRVSELR